MDQPKVYTTSIPGIYHVYYIYIYILERSILSVIDSLCLAGWWLSLIITMVIYIYIQYCITFLHQDILASEIGHRTNNYKSFRFSFPSNLLMSVTAVGFVASQLNIGRTFGMSLWSGCLM